jgi:hypothetical protein
MERNDLDVGFNMKVILLGFGDWFFGLGSVLFGKF